MSDQATRTQIEARVVEKLERIDFQTLESEWMDDPQFWEFIDAWKELEQYYQEHDDNSIGLKLVFTYVVSLQMATGRLYDKELDTAKRLRAGEMLQTLEDRMHKLVEHAIGYDAP
jgi:hypothetical protein